ncbi:MAG: hypothetical protein MUE81_09125 [Thermoflexibacter sp.]|jgi:hypothetical protein|nr:hypothetical protein [Thermoflexibacter sp.]
MIFLKYHPLETSIKDNPKAYFFSLLIATILVQSILAITGNSLKTLAAPMGILSYEFALNIENAQFIVNSWDKHALIAASFNIGFDYLFLFCYSTTIAFACIWLANLIGNVTFAKIAYGLAWLQWIAACLDGIENAALYIFLLSPTQAICPPIAFWCATFKFLLVIMGILYILIASIFLLIKRIKS